MAGSLIKIDEEIVTSAVASVTLGGSDWDSSYDVYMVKFNNVQPDTDIVSFTARLTVSGSPDTSSNYDRAMKELRADGAFNNYSGNYSAMFLDGAGTGTSELVNGIAYLFNFNNASEYSFITAEVTEINSSADARGNQGGGVHTVASASDGVYFFDTAGGNIASGTFTLYGLKK